MFTTKVFNKRKQAEHMKSCLNQSEKIWEWAIFMMLKKKEETIDTNWENVEQIDLS